MNWKAIYSVFPRQYLQEALMVSLLSAAQRVVAGRTTYLSGTLRQAVTVATHMARVLHAWRSWMETYLNVQTIGRTCPISGQEAELIHIFNAPRWFGLMSARLTPSSASTPSWMSGKS